MKVLILNTLYHPFKVGGAERSTQLLAEALCRSGHEVEVACTSPPGESKRADINGVTVHYVGLKNVYWQFDEQQKEKWKKPVWHVLNSYSPFMQQPVRELLDTVQPDVLHTNNLGGFSVSAWRAASHADIPVIHTLRDYALLCPQNMYRDGSNCSSQCLMCRPFAWPRRHMSREVTTVVGISRFILERHEQYGYFEDVAERFVIHNPLRASQPPLQGSPSAQHAASDGQDVLHLGFLGRLSPMKGIEQLLSTIQSLDDVPLRLSIGGVGKEDYEQRLRKKYEGGAIQFCGYVDPQKFLPSLDGLVVPSHWHEPFGRVVVEAYSHGVPVLASRRGGLPEIVTHGETGYVFSMDATGELRELLIDLGNNPEELRKLRSGARLASRDFRVPSHIEAYEAAYEATRMAFGQPSGF